MLPNPQESVYSTQMCVLHFTLSSSVFIINFVHVITAEQAPN